MKYFTLFAVIAAFLCSPLFVASAQAKTAHAHNAKAHGKHHHGHSHHKSSHHKLG